MTTNIRRVLESYCILRWSRIRMIQIHRVDTSCRVISIRQKMCHFVYIYNIKFISYLLAIVNNPAAIISTIPERKSITLCYKKHNKFKKHKGKFSNQQCVNITIRGKELLL